MIFRSRAHDLGLIDYAKFNKNNLLHLAKENWAIQEAQRITEYKSFELFLKSLIIFKLDQSTHSENILELTYAILNNYYPGGPWKKPNKEDEYKEIVEEYEKIFKNK